MINLLERKSINLCLSAIILSTSGCRTSSNTEASEILQYSIDDSVNSIRFRICGTDETTKPFQRRKRQNSARTYRKKAYTHMVELLSVRSALLLQPDSNLLSDINTNPNELKNRLPKSCTENSQSWWSKIFRGEDKVNINIASKFYKNWKSEEVISLTYPSHIKLANSTCGTDPSILKAFQKQAYPQIHHELDKICTDGKLNSHLVSNPTIAASMMIRYPEKAKKINDGYCAAKKTVDWNRKFLGQWDNISPWLYAGISLITGSIVGIISRQKAGFLAGSLPFDIAAITEHTFRNKHLIKQLAYLEGLQDKAIVPNCSREELRKDIEKMKTFLVFDSIGVAVSLALGFSSPGVGRGIAAALKTEKAILYPVVKGSSSALYFVIPGIKLFFRLPSVSVLVSAFQNGIKSAQLIATNVWPKESQKGGQTIADSFVVTINSLRELRDLSSGFFYSTKKISSFLASKIENNFAVSLQ